MEGLHFNGLHLNENGKDDRKIIRENSISNGDVNIKEKDRSDPFSNSFSSTVNYDPDEIEDGEPHDVRQPTRNAHVNPVDINANADSGNFPASSSPSMVRSDRERQILIMMLLAQVCAMHDSTPKTFTIYLLNLYEQGMLDYENSIGFLCGMGLVPTQLRLPPAALHVPSVIPVSQSQQQPQPQTLNEDVSRQLEPQKNNDNTAAIVPYTSPTHANASTETTSNYSGHDKTDEIQTTRNAEAHSRMLQVGAIRRYLESQELSPTNTNCNNKNNKNNKNNSSTKHQSNVNFAGIQNILDNPITPLSSWAVEDHPLSVSRYSREFIQRKQLGCGSFGQVFLATNKLDNCDYAVKKTIFAAKGYDTKEVEMVIREVKCLAKLDHENVVRYYTSWLEPTWTMTGNTSSPNTSHNKRGEDETVAVSCPDEVASKDVQRKMLCSIQQLVYGDKQDSKSMDSYTSNQENTMGNPSTFYDGVTTADYGRIGGGFCACSFDSSSNNQTRNVDSWNNLPSYKNNHNSSMLNSISTGGYGEDSECSEWTIDQQQSSAGNCHAKNHNANHHMYSHRQGQQQQQQQQREKSYRYQICLYIQMQLCDPSTLADWIRRRNSSSSTPNDTLTKKWCKHYDIAWEIFLQIVQGLAHIHSQGIIHRDLKPANIFPAGDGLFKVGDFGLSTMLKKMSTATPDTDGGGSMDFSGKDDGIAQNDINQVDNLTALTLSKHKQFDRDEWQDPLTSGIGTATYAAPEQIVSSSYGTRADIFSLGLILLELFCSFGSEHERATTFHDCRRGKLPLWIVSAYPFKNIAHLIIFCTKSNPLERPMTDEILKLSIYEESSTASAVTHINEGAISNRLQLELRRRDKIITEQGRLLLEKDALLDKQAKDLKQMEHSLKRLMDRSNTKVNDP